jgi:hypothetical protein
LSIAVPLVGIILMGLVIWVPKWLSVIFGTYSLLVLYLTA